MGRQLRRVPLDFDWPTGTTWDGFLNPFYKARRDCPDCGGTGYAPEARRFYGQWYGNSPFDPVAYGATPLKVDDPAVQAFAARNVDHSPEFYRVEALGRDAAIRHESYRLFGHFRNQWNHHLIQADVDALVAQGRLHDLTHTFVPGNGWQPIEPTPVVTPEAVNAWSLSGMGHDGINAGVCVNARCEREGVPATCPACEGHGDRWPSKAHKALAEGWNNIEPPAGDGYQMWETTSEGSPISPPLASPEELARWLADTNASAFGGEGATYEQWLKMIGREWAPSAVLDARGFRSGVAV